MQIRMAQSWMAQLWNTQIQIMQFWIVHFGLYNFRFCSSGSCRFGSLRFGSCRFGSCISQIWVVQIWIVQIWIVQIWILLKYCSYQLSEHSAMQCGTDSSRMQQRENCHWKGHGGVDVTSRSTNCCCTIVYNAFAPMPKAPHNGV